MIKLSLERINAKSPYEVREAIEAMRLQSEQNGNDAMTLDDINNEIRQARAARKTTV